MTIVRRLCALGLAAALAVAGSVSAQPADGLKEAIAAANTESLEQLAHDVDRLHPIAMALLASRLLQVNRKGEAEFWFYEAQLRWLARFGDYPELARQGSFGNESEGERYERVLGAIEPDINEYSLGHVDDLPKLFDRVLEWDAAHRDTFAPLGPGKEKSRKKFLDYRASIVANIDKLHKLAEQRRAKEQAQSTATNDDPYMGDGGGFMTTPQELVGPCAADRFKGFKPGASTKADVVRALGAPETWSTDKDGAGELSYACNGTPMGAGGLSFTKRLSISYRFDPKKVLVAVEWPKDDMHR